MGHYWTDPLTDSRWSDLVARHPSASIFHTTGWLEALRRTYGFVPALLTTSPEDRPLVNGIVLCRVMSRLTGRRLVSLPFSDHCRPLVDDPADLAALLETLVRTREDEGWKYVEIRSLDDPAEKGGRAAGFAPCRVYHFHVLDLGPSLDELAAGMHRDCVVRKIRRAERDGLRVEAGRSVALLRQFYGMQLKTRRRLRLPPQPFAWFRNLAECLGEQMTVRVASLKGRAVAGIITIAHRDTMVYKYGCSDQDFNRHGGNQLLLWLAVREAKTRGLRQLDLGRTDFGHKGLLDFKERWGGRRSTCAYQRYPDSKANPTPGRPLRYGSAILALLPNTPLSIIGNIFYRHFA